MDPAREERHRMNETSVFFSAVERGDLDAVRAWLASDPELVRARDAMGATALHVAAFHAHRAIVELLLSAGAELNARDGTYGGTPAGWAMHYLRERGALLGTEIEDMLFAIQRGDTELVARFIVRHPALANAVDPDGKPLVDHADEASEPEIGLLFARARSQTEPAS
jgi:Ankyrin repeats (3 copies)